MRRDGTYSQSDNVHVEFVGEGHSHNSITVDRRDHTRIIIEDREY